MEKLRLCSVLLWCMLAIPAIAADAPVGKDALRVSSPTSLTITPEKGSENPVPIGQLATLRIGGLEDPALGRTSVWPEAFLLPVLVQDAPAEGSWKLWGSFPAVQFRAGQLGRYKVTVLEAADGSDPLAEYVVEVGGPIPPPDLLVRPETPFRLSGDAGGPFTPLEQTYTIQASEPSWEAVVQDEIPDLDWLAVYKGRDYVTLRVLPVADAFDAGEYRAKLTITLGDRADYRDVLLTVGQEPDPDPDPGPDPDPVTSLLVIMLHESDEIDDNPWMANIKTSQKIKRLATSDVKIFFVDVHEKDQRGTTPETVKTWIELAANMKVVLPHVFLVNQNQQLVHHEPWPQEVDAVVALIEEYAP